MHTHTYTICIYDAENSSSIRLNAKELLWLLNMKQVDGVCVRVCVDAPACVYMHACVFACMCLCACVFLCESEVLAQDSGCPLGFANMALPPLQ